MKLKLDSMKKLLYLITIITMLTMLVSCTKKDIDDTHESNIVDTNDIIDSKSDLTEKESLTLAITEIGEDYFLASHPWPSPSEYKVYCKNLDEDLCEGDYVDVYYEEIKEVTENTYFELTAIEVLDSDFKLEPGKAYKPVIYLYPKDPIKVSISLDYNGTLTHTYPLYEDGWIVTAYPDGRILDVENNEYPYLFWEGESDIQYDMSKGFCVKGNETEKFLTEKLSYMGLNEKELQDFMDFWVPFMEENPYNKISFQTTIYTDNAKLTVNPKPDSMLRIFMVYQPLDEFVLLEEQELTKFSRTGFSLIEWGGSIIE